MRISLFFIPFFLFTIASCSSSITMDTEYDCRTLTKSDICYEDCSYEVSYSDILRYSHYKVVKDSKREVISITPITVNDSLVVFYAVDYNNGWELISSDKRGPIVLGSSEDGFFEKAVSENEALKCWVENLAYDIVSRIENVDRSEFVNSDVLINEQACIDFWNMVCYDKPPVNDTSHIANDGNRLLPDGHWELGTVTSEEIFYDRLQHLCHTSWDQNAPYNMYCPYKTDGSGERAPAGCNAISAAQMLCYLNEYYGIPAYAPSTILEGGNINSYYVYIGDYCSEAWTAIHNNAADTTAILIRDIGQRLGMEYGNSGSTAHTSDMPVNVFLPYGISCYYTEYSVPDVFESLLDNMPVIARASGIKTTNIFGVDSYSGGHSFIIDGYVRYRTKETVTYHWVWDPHSQPLPEIEDNIIITWYSPHINEIYMNWGWLNGYNSVAFSPAGDWYTLLSSGPHHFNYNRHMVIGFSVLPDE